MTKTLGELLGELPSGEVVPYNLSEVAEYIRDGYLENDAETERKEAARQRLDLYHDRGGEQLDEVLCTVFNNSEVLALRRAFISYSQFQNITKRVVNEISTVYSEATMRAIKAGNDGYQNLLRAVKQDRVLRKANRYCNLLNECMIMFRVRGQDMAPRLDVITPDRFHAISHPLEPTELIAVVFYSKPDGGGGDDADTPTWTVWTDAEVFRLNGHGEAMTETYQLHGYGRIPGVLVHRDIPDSCLLDGTTGGDLISAHKAVALLNVLMLKEQKSGTKIPYTVGDLGQTPMGQAADSENLVSFEEGITPGTMDLGSDPRRYIDAVRSVVKQVAANYGIPESVFDLSYGVGSGVELEIRRMGLMEKRREQIVEWRDIERELVAVQSAVLSASGAPAAFSLDGWTVDFGEVETPSNPMEMLRYWEKLREMTLANTVDFVAELNPELTEEQCASMVDRNIDVETLRVMKMKTLMQLNGSVSSGPDEPTAEENGDDGNEEAEAEKMQ